MNFFKNIVKTILKALFSACIVNFLILFFIAYCIGSSITKVMESKPVEVKKNSVLFIDTSMNLSDIALGGRIDVVVSDYAKMSLLELYEKIVSAGSDSRIESIFIYNSKSDYAFNISQSLGIRRALVDFKATGKKVYYYLGNPNVTQSEYFLASISDEIWINPQSVIDFGGVHFTGTFIGNAFEKYGVKANVLKCGANKSFGDMFTRADFAPEAKTDLEDIAVSWSDFLSSTSFSARNVSDTLKLDNPMQLAKSALELNLVDKVLYRDEVDAILGVDDAKFSYVNVKNYIPNYSINTEKTSEGLAVIYMTGTIVEFGNGSNQIGAARYARILKEIRNNDNIKAVAIVFNSGGGSAYASEQIRREVEILAKAKPTIAYVTSACASGAYWIATACDKIYAQETSLIGSIGVFSILFDIEQLSANFGVTYDVAKSGEYSDLSSIMTRSPSPAELAIKQEQVDDIYENFVSLVSKSRGIAEDIVKSDIATGSVWTSKKAMDLGLIDSADNNLPHTLKKLAKDQNLGKNYGIYTYPRPKTYNELFAELFSGESSVVAKYFLPKSLAEQLELSKELSNFNDPHNLYLRSPFILKEF